MLAIVLLIFTEGITSDVATTVTFAVADVPYALDTYTTNWKVVSTTMLILEYGTDRMLDLLAVLKPQLLPY